MPTTTWCQHRHIYISSFKSMPRRARLQVVEDLDQDLEEEIAPTLDKWSEYVSKGRISSSDFTSITNFGSIRLDNDNKPKDLEQVNKDHDVPKSGKHYSETPQSPISGSTDYLGLMNDDSKYDKFTAFQSSKSDSYSNKNLKPIWTKSEDNSSVPNVENQTIPVQFDSKDQDDNDLNYFDEIVFNESYTKFNSKTGNVVQDVKIDPAVFLAQGQRSEQDLNFIDQTYFSSSPPDLKSDSLPTYSVKTRADHKPVTETSDLKILKKQKEMMTSTESVTIKQEDRKEVEKVTKNKKKKEKVRLSTEGTALEYVRKLRKQSDGQSEMKHPTEMMGKHLQDRILEATSNLHQSRLSNSKQADDDEEAEGQQVTHYVDVKKYKPPDLDKYTKKEVADLMISKIIYNDHDIVAIWKPYGMPMFGDTNGKTKYTKHKNRFSLESFLPDIAKKVECEKLFEVHRLDSTTTGVVLYAKTKEMEMKLRKLFLERKVKKNYLAILNGTPQADSGIIDIPIGEGKVGERMRKTLRPDYNSSKIISNKKTSELESESAVTEYNILSTFNNSSFVSTQIETGRKHQIRAHLGLGLGTPILGDHKYSYPTQLGKPQNIHGDILMRMKLRKSKSRHLPIYLHARRITIPGVLPDGNNLIIVASLPHFFSKTLQKLKLKAKTF